MSSVLARRMAWTEQDYLRMEADSPIKHEFLDGEIYAMAGTKSHHNVIAANSSAALVNLAQDGPCAVFNSDQRIHVASPKTFYTYADGGVACGQWEILDKDGMSLLNPILLFEVLSFSTRNYDRGAKLLLYRQIPSLTDVLIIDQPEQMVEHHHRGLRGWKETARRRGTISVLGGLIRMDALYRVPPGLPDDE